MVSLDPLSHSGARRNAGSSWIGAASLAAGMVMLTSCAPPPSSSLSASSAQQLANVQIEIGPAASVQARQDGVALVREGGGVRQVPVRSTRDGTRVTLTNAEGQKVCDLDLNAANSSTCFGTAFSDARAFPLSRMGTSVRPFVFAGTVAGEPLAIFVGTEGIPQDQMCWRLTTTISRVGQEMGRQACPNEPVRIAAPIEGTRVSYSDGTNVEVSQAQEGNIRISTLDSGRNRISDHFYLNIIRSLSRQNFCFNARDLIYPKSIPSSCDRAAQGGYSHAFKITFSESRLAITDRTLDARSFLAAFEVRGQLTNYHLSNHRIMIWAASGLPIMYNRYLERGTLNEGGPDSVSTNKVLVPGP